MFIVQQKIKLLGPLVRIIAMVILCFCISGQLDEIQARSTRDDHIELIAPTTTIADSSIGTLDDPNNSATTSDSGEMTDDICYRCYDKMIAAENLIAFHTNLVAKQKEIIRRKNKPSPLTTNSRPVINPSLRSTQTPPARLLSDAAEPMDTESTPMSTITSSTNNRASTVRKPNPSLRNRTLEYSEPIIVSRLRVARSPLLGDQNPTITSDTAASNSNNNNKKYGRNRKDPLLKKLKQEQEQQLNATCASILTVQECLQELSRTCIGDLTYHSLEVWATQWHGKLSCPYRSNPNVRVFPGLTQRIYSYPANSPIARPITSNEEVRKRMDQMFPNGAIRPPGVMLKPNNGPAAQPKSMNFLNQQQQQLGQQLQPIGKVYQNGQLPNFQSSANYLNRLQYSTPDDEFNLLNVGKSILIPSCFVVLVAFVIVTSLYLRREKERIDEKV